MLLSDTEKNHIKAGMKILNCAPLIKFHHILAYQIELGYDLAISPDHNTSSSPGFESVLGVINDDVIE